MRSVLRIVVVLVAGVTGVSALYMRAETIRVPVQRLVTNLERDLRKAPDDGALHLRLARVHAMAWTLATSRLEVSRAGEHVMFGYEPPNVPFASWERERAAGATPAHTHLLQAIAHHRRAVALLPDDLTAELGLAWCLDRAGERTEAIARYRAVGERAWASERQLTSLGLGQHPIAAEAATYLIPLLDPVADAREMAQLNERKALEKLPRPITPIVVPLDNGAPVDTLVDRDARVAFDLDGRALGTRWSWITPKAAWLVWDPEGTGDVRSGLDLFGSVTFWLFWPDGYRALAGLDDDGDGWISGAERRGLALWRDGNADGVADPGEVAPLDGYGVAALRCIGVPGDSADVVAWAPDGVRMRDGSHRPSFDLRMWPAPDLVTTRR